MPPGPINRLAESMNPRGEAYQAGLRRVANLMESRTQSAFRTQGRGGMAWPPRKTPNVAGALSDLAVSSNVKERRFEARPALTDTGSLRKSIAAEVKGGAVEYGSRLEYASAMQRGQPSTIQVTETIKKNLATYLRRQTRKGRKGGKWSGEALRRDVSRSAFGWLFHVTEVTVKPHARPFVVLTAQDREDVGTAFRETLLRASVRRP